VAAGEHSSAQTCGLALQAASRQRLMAACTAPAVGQAGVVMLLVLQGKHAGFT
jgi:hypothetical protein